MIIIIQDLCEMRKLHNFVLFDHTQIEQFIQYLCTKYVYVFYTYTKCRYCMYTVFHSLFLFTTDFTVLLYIVKLYIIVVYLQVCYARIKSIIIITYKANLRTRVIRNL